MSAKPTTKRTVLQDWQNDRSNNWTIRKKWLPFTYDGEKARSHYVRLNHTEIIVNIGLSSDSEDRIGDDSRFRESYEHVLAIGGGKFKAAFAMDSDSASWVVGRVGSLARIIWGRSAANKAYYTLVDRLQAKLTNVKARLDAEAARKLKKLQLLRSNHNNMLDYSLQILTQLLDSPLSDSRSISLII